MGSVCGSSNSDRKKEKMKDKANTQNGVIRENTSNSGTTNTEVNVNRQVTNSQQQTNTQNNIHTIDINANVQNNPIEHRNSNSINEEFTSQRLQSNTVNYRSLYPHANSNSILPFVRNIHDLDILRNYCGLCGRLFMNTPEYHSHFTNCAGLRSNRTVHRSIAEILQLVQTLNRQLQGESAISLILGEEEPEETYDFIDWSCEKAEDGSVYWKNEGKVHLTKEELNKISNKSSIVIQKEKIYVKRIWLLRYINKFIYDKSSANTTIVVSRNNILTESFEQFMTTQDLDLRRAMHIFFIDEVAHDVGGVYREWYTSIFKEVFSKENNFFYLVDEKCIGRNSYFMPVSVPNKQELNYLDYYAFIGKIIGKAFFDKMTISTNINIVLIKHLLKIKLTIEDLKYLDNGYYESLLSLLESHIGGDSGLYFTWNMRYDDENVKEVELIPNGSQILLTDENKKLFVDKVVNFICYESVKQKIDYFIKGFYSVLPYDYIRIFTAEEFDFLLAGQTMIDLQDWRKHTVYKGYYNDNYPIVKCFWEVLSELSTDKLILFLKFCTGCTKIPIDGFCSLMGSRNKIQKFCIESPAINDNAASTKRLIEANTCFNRILLPDYESKEKLKNVINIILDNDTNFFGKQ